VPILLLQSIFNAGLAMFVARLTAKVHDVRQLLPYILRIWMYGSAILYPVTFFAQRIDGWLLAVVHANPLLVFIELMRHALMENVELASSPGLLWIQASIWTLLVGIGGYVYFWRGEKGYGRG
jgi:teichoic acid transport system permease protein